jgi:hypothetical protein
MGLVDPDPLAVLPVRAASASAAFARACDPHRERAERREHLRLLELTLTAVRQLLDRCDEEAAQLALEVFNDDLATSCAGRHRPCRRCFGAAVDGPEGVGRVERCNCSVERHGAGGCSERSAVTLRDESGASRVLCLKHAADALRQGDHLAVVAGSRCSRAALAEVAGETCLASRRPSRLADAPGRSRSA